MFAKYLKQFGKKYCFTSRDCYFLYNIYRFMYPNDICVYFWSSRIAFKNKTNSYINYVSKYVNNYTFVDLGGTNQSYYNFMSSVFGFIPHKVLLILYNNSNNYNTNLEYLFTLDEVNESKIEEFNRSPEKSCIDDVINNNPIYKKKYFDETDIYRDECVKCYEYIFQNISPKSLLSVKYDKNKLRESLKKLQYV